MNTRLMSALAFGSLFVLGCGDDSGSGGGTTSSSSSSTGTSSSSSSQASTSSTTSSSSGTGGNAAFDVTLQFQAVVGAEPLACGTVYTGIGADGSAIEISDFRFYVHDVRLVTTTDEEVPVELEQDGMWQVENVALLDFEDASGACQGGTAQTRTVVTGTVPTGDYAGVRFRVGVPAELNHADVATSPAPLNLTSLFWSWAFGHLHLSAVTSIALNGGGGANQHFVHLGSTGCMGDPTMGEMVTCSNPNRPEFAFDTFDPASGVIVADLAELVAASNLATEIGCHSFPATPACVEPFDRLGIDYDTGMMTPATQVFFRVE